VARPWGDCDARGVQWK
jgi:hypothetical protein